MATRVVALLMLTMIDSGESKGNRSSHRHFKTVTAMSPLQYQKQTRSLKARSLLIAHGAVWPLRRTRSAMKARPISAGSTRGSLAVPCKKFSANHIGNEDLARGNGYRLIGMEPCHSIHRLLPPYDLLLTPRANAYSSSAARTCELVLGARDAKVQVMNAPDVNPYCGICKPSFHSTLVIKASPSVT
jgi:AraC-like DNA-binding protein